MPFKILGSTEINVRRTTHAGKFITYTDPTKQSTLILHISCPNVEGVQIGMETKVSGPIVDSIPQDLIADLYTGNKIKKIPFGDLFQGVSAEPPLSMLENILFLQQAVTDLGRIGRYGKKCIKSHLDMMNEDRVSTDDLMAVGAFSRHECKLETGLPKYDQKTINVLCFWPFSGSFSSTGLTSLGRLDAHISDLTSLFMNALPYNYLLDYSRIIGPNGIGLNMQELYPRFLDDNFN